VHPTFGTLNWITPYGLMLVVALIVCWFYARQRTLAAGLDVSHTDLAVPLVFVISLLGARIITVIIPGDAEFVGELIQTHSRFRLFGLLFVGIPALFAYSRLTKQSFRGLLDLFALPVVLWLAIVRLGCFMAGCCWGDLTFGYSRLADVTDQQLAIQVFTLPWLSGDWIFTATSFPFGSFAYLQHVTLGLIDQGAVSSLPVHPTQLYESVLLIVLLLVLKSAQSKRPIKGMLALAATATYAVLRFFIEFLRADNTLVLGHLTSTQLICIVLICGSVAGVPILKRLSIR
jgi:phosphatidylglycerol:prolipoprotein diacylglycerol transferase